MHNSITVSITAVSMHWRAWRPRWHHALRQDGGGRLQRGDSKHVARKHHMGRLSSKMGDNCKHNRTITVNPVGCMLATCRHSRELCTSNVFLTVGGAGVHQTVGIKACMKQSAVPNPSSFRPLHPQQMGHSTAAHDHILERFGAATSRVLRAVPPACHA